jgi:hypothetical protein
MTACLVSTLVEGAKKNKDRIHAYSDAIVTGTARAYAMALAIFSEGEPARTAGWEATSESGE